METFIDLHFPFVGIDVSEGYAKQPPRQIEEGRWARSSFLGVNVRSFEPATNRMRGGSRCGLVKLLAAAVVADWVIQELNVVTTVDDSAVA